MGNGENEVVKKELLKIFDDAFQHDGFSDFHVEIKILKRKQKEVIIHYGKQYRYVLDYKNQDTTIKDTPKPATKRQLTSVES